MGPQLVLPARNKRDQREYPVTVVAAKTFVATLPTETLARLRDLDGALAALTWANMDRSRRFGLLNVYRKDLQNMENQRQGDLAGVSLPLSGKSRAICLAYRGAYGRVGDVYKRIIMEAARFGNQKTPGLTKDLTWACYWAVYYLGQSLRVSYACYCLPRPRTWFEIHQIMQYAQFLGIDKSGLRVAKNTDAIRSINHLYKRMLLLGLSDPYQLPYRTVRAVYNASDRWATRVQLERERPGASTTSLFLVEFDLDRPAMPMLPRARLPAGGSWQILDARVLVKHLKRKMNRATSEALRQFDSEKERFSRFEKMETLRSLIIRWGLHPVRNWQRQSSVEQCAMVVGLNAIARLLNGNRGLPVPSPQSAPGSRSERTEDLPVRPEIGDKPWGQTWDLADESAQGVRLSLGRGEHVQVRVGELVAYRKQRGGGSWSLGMVRWAQTGESGRLTVGVSKIGSDPQPALIERKAADPAKSPTRSTALIITPRGDGEQSIVCDRGLYKPKSNLWVYDGDSRRIVGTHRVLNSTRCFIWFETASAKTSTQETLELIQPSFC